MATTTSLAFPRMFNLSSNEVAVDTDTASVVNRSRLLILTEPTELYNNPDFGVGLRRHLWQYNTENEKAIIKDRIVNQLRLHEPSVIAENTKFADGLLVTGTSGLNSAAQANELNMTVIMETTFAQEASISLNSNSL
jgi:phage baseplate assembly protein W